MKKVLSITLIFMVFMTASKASTTWIGPSGGTWSNAANWSSGIPNSGNDAIINGFTGIINMNSGGSAKALNITGNSSVVFQNSSSTISFASFQINYEGFPKIVSNIEAGSTLTMAQTDPSANAQMNVTVRYGNELNVYGSLIFTGNSPICTSFLRPDSAGKVKIYGLLQFGPNTGNTIFNSYSQAEFQVMAGGVYEMNKNGGVIPGSFTNQPKVVYDPASTIKITGVTTTFPTFNDFYGYGNLYCGNLWYESPGQSATVNANLPFNFLIKGNLTVANTNSNILQLATSLINLTINGNFDVGPFGGTGQVKLSNSAASSITTVLGNTTVGSGWKLDLQSATGATALNLEGGLTVNGELTESGTSTITYVFFNGSVGDQTLIATGPISNSVKIQVNKSSGSLVLGSDIVLNNVLTLTDNKVILGDYDLEVPGIYPASITTTASYIVTDGLGMLRMPVTTGTVEFPVGPSTSVYAPVRLSSDNSVFEVRSTVPLSAPDGGAYVNLEWEITPTLIVNPATVHLQWPSTVQAGGFDPAMCHVSHFNGDDWEQITPDGPASNASIIGSYTTFATGVTNFSPFSVGGVGNLVPLELLSFQGWEEDKGNMLEWVTASEDKVSTFDIERSATGAGDWSSIGQIPARNVSGTHQYNYEDAATLAQSYYRLVIRDFDGTAVFSDIISIKRTGAGPDFQSITPNPFTDRVTVEFFGANEHPSVIRMTNTAGITVLETTVNFTGAGMHRLDLPITSLPAGIYFITLTNGDEKVVRRVVKA